MKQIETEYTEICDETRNKALETHIKLRGKSQIIGFISKLFWLNQQVKSKIGWKCEYCLISMKQGGKIKIVVL